MTLKPPQEDVKKENPDDKIGKEVFIFGKPHPDRGFSFKMNQWFCGIGSSVKKIFGLK